MLRLSPGYIVLFLLFLGSNRDAFCQDQTNAHSKGIWDQQFHLGISAGYPIIPFVNLGVVFNNKVYGDAFIEPVYSRIHASYFTLGYQQHKLFKQNISGQIGISYIQVAGKNRAQKISAPGMNIKILAPLSKRFGMFVSGFAAYPDRRIERGRQANINIGINFYIDEFPNPAFWLD